MELRVEIIAKEIIKPSRPTLFHLKTFKLSLIDQHMHDVPVSVILFYSANIENHKQLDHLKESLSEVLTDFYPLAGSISGNQFVDCDDGGANFIKTQVSALLRQFISHPEPDKLKQLVPMGSKALLSIQANQFECGGLAIAVSMSHKLGDASSLCLFINHWAALSRGERKEVTPSFDTSSIFSPQDESPQINEQPIQKLVSKRFVFDAANISALKAKISDDGEVPTRVQAVSALIWWCVLNVARLRTGVAKPQSLLYFPVNLRGRMVPPQTNSSFGNFALCTLIKTNTETHPGLMHSLVAHLRESVKNVDGNYIKQVQARDGYLAHLAPLAEASDEYLRGELEFLSLTSLCRFPFYEADFGWGEPIWATYTGFSVKNFISLMDTKCGQGVEAWVTMEEEDMAKFNISLSSQLIAFSSTSPRINQIINN